MDVDDAGRRLGRALVGDRVGLALLLGGLAFYGLYWRVDVFIVDTFAIANVVTALAEGHFYIDPMTFGPEGEGLPGMYRVGDHVYGRNYGQAALAVPILWALRGIAAIADLRIALAAGWSLLVLGTCVVVGDLLDQQDRFTWIGATLAFGLFAVNLSMATDLPPRVFPLVALQLSTMLAAALVGVTVYRTCALTVGRRVGTFAGVATLLVGPVGFWAVIPKRHALTTLLATVVLYGLVRSRAAPTDETRFRAVAYAAVALAAWVHAAEALVLLVALVPADLLTARRRTPRTFVALGVAFLLALMPFLLTNLTIVGNPLEPPRMLPVYGGGAVTDPNAGMLEASGSSGGGGSGSGGGGGSGGTSGSASPGPLVPLGLLGPLAGLAEFAVAAFGRLFGMFGQGLDALGIERLYHVFVRSGRIPGVRYAQTGGETIDLTLLESAPIAAALLAMPAVVARRATHWCPAPRTLVTRLTTPEVGPRLFAGTFVVLLSLANLHRLPLHSTITVRYLAPIAPFLVFGLAHVPALQRVIEHEWRLVGGLTAVLLPLGSATAAVGGAVAGLSTGGGMQAHAVVNLAVAGLIACWLLAESAIDEPLDDRVGAALLALVLAAMGAFLLLSGVEYLGQGREFALPLARALERLVSVL